MLSCTRERNKIMLQFQTLVVVSDRKMNLVGTLGGKTGIFTQNQFSTKSIFLYGCNSKTNPYKYLKFSPNFYVNSERSEECIDFTMMCVFFFYFIFVSVTTFWSMDPVSDRKVNVVCTLRGQNFQKRREKPKKNDGKTGIFTQNKFSTKSIFLYGFNSKTNHCKFLKFSPNIYVSVIYIHVDKNILDNQKVLKI
ncbi:Uncharacterized protein FWK35_00020967, partial [Aphis craccivora]